MAESPGVAGPRRLTWRSLLRRAEERLGGTDARRVVERVSGYDGADLWLHLDEDAPARVVPFLDSLVDRRRGQEPLQYVLGRWGFRRLDLFLDRRVLIPRPETETVVEVALAELRRLRPKPRPVLVDLGTGSGAIGLSLAVEVPGARVWGTDVSPEAIAVARANLTGVGSWAGPRVTLREGSWWDALPGELRGEVDLVVANPPYVAAGEELPPDVADWEPTAALVSGPTGLEATEVIVAGAPAWLSRPGTLVVEVAPPRADVVAGLARAAGFTEVQIHPDLSGRPRTLVGRF